MFNPMAMLPGATHPRFCKKQSEESPGGNGKANDRNQEENASLAGVDFDTPPTPPAKDDLRSSLKVSIHLL